MLRFISGCALLAAALLASAPAHAEGEQPDPPPSEAAHSLRGWGALGGSTGSLWNVSFEGVHADAGFGVERGGLTLPILLDLDLDKTAAGLTVGQLGLSTAISARIGRFRIGGGPEISYAWMTRSRGASSGNIDALGLGVCALASFDVIDLGDDRAIALMLRGEAMWLNDRREYFSDFSSGTVVPRASLAVGVRF